MWQKAGSSNHLLNFASISLWETFHLACQVVISQDSQDSCGAIWPLQPFKGRAQAITKDNPPLAEVSLLVMVDLSILLQSLNRLALSQWQVHHSLEPLSKLSLITTRAKPPSRPLSLAQEMNGGGLISTLIIGLTFYPPLNSLALWGQQITPIYRCVNWPFRRKSAYENTLGGWRGSLANQTKALWNRMRFRLTFI